MAPGQTGLHGAAATQIAGCWWQFLCQQLFQINTHTAHWHFVSSLQRRMKHLKLGFLLDQEHQKPELHQPQPAVWRRGLWRGRGRCLRLLLRGQLLSWGLVISFFCHQFILMFQILWILVALRALNPREVTSETIPWLPASAVDIAVQTIILLLL